MIESQHTDANIQIDEEAIVQQQELLTTYRRTLVHLLRQAAQHSGERSAPPQVASGIAEARAQIKQLKAGLREGGTSVADMLIDEPPPAPAEPNAADYPGEPSAGARPSVQTGQQIS